MNSRADTVQELRNGTAETRLLALIEGQVLSPAHRRIAKAILRDPQESMFLSSVDLARKAGVSQPSVTRFAITLGFSGFTEMQRKLRELIGGLAEEREISQTDSAVHRSLESEHRNLDVLRSTIDEASVARVGANLMKCGGVLSLGVRASAALACYFGYLAEKIRPNVHLEVLGGSAAPDRLLRASRDNVEWIVAFSFPRYPQEVLDLLVYGRELGMKVLGITDHPLSPVRDHSDELLFAPVGSTLVFDSQAAPMLLATILLEAMTDADPQLAQDRLDELDEMLIRKRIFASEGVRN